MNLLDPLKKIVMASGNYLMDKSTLSNAFSGLLRYLALLEEKISRKQDKLIAGSNITITGNTISSTGGGGGGGTVTSVSASVPSPASPAYSVTVANPSTTPAIAITANGTTSDYVRGDGSLAPFPAIPSAITVSGRTGDVIVNLSGSNYEVTTVVSPFLLMGG
jgi:hypothetical protein